MKTINNKIFKSIPGFSGYYCSSDGEIYSEKTHHILKPNFNTGAVEYPTICLYDNKKNNCLFIHKLVALTWCPLPPDSTVEGVLGNWLSRELVVDHIDGNKKNFNASNLRWCTSFQNSNFDNYDKNGRVAALKGNQNAKNRKISKDSGKIHYIYHYDGKDYTLAELVNALNFTKSKITESFRRNLGLVRKGLLTRTAILSEKYKAELLAELEGLLRKLGDSIGDETNPDTIRANEIITIIAEYSKESK